MPIASCSSALTKDLNPGLSKSSDPSCYYITTTTSENDLKGKKNLFSVIHIKELGVRK